MAEENITLFGFFDVYGRVSENTWRCFFSTEGKDLNIKFIYNGKEYNGKDDIFLKRYKLKPAEGILTDNDMSLKNVKIDFVKNIKHLGSVTVDSTFTDSSGRYTAYIEPGIYDIVINTRNGKIVKKNISLQEGIKCDRNIFVSGSIKHKHHDITELHGTDYNYVFGKVVDRFEKPVYKAQVMIIKDKEIIINTFTNRDGEYRFSVPYGEYIVRMKKEDSPFKTKTVVLDKEHGFAEQMTDDIRFRTDKILFA